MAETPSAVEIPNRALFKASEVCDLAKVQPYVLRSWEAEFRDLGVTRSGSTARVYRRADVERVLRIKHLVLIEGLTLAGVRRKLEGEQEAPLELDDLPAVVASPKVNDAVRERVGRVKRELRSLLALLTAPRAATEVHGSEAVASTTTDFALAPPAAVEKLGSKSSKRSSAGEMAGKAASPASPRRKRSA